MTTVLLSITLASILALTLLAWLVRAALWPALCPLCAGVAGTWMALLAAHWAGVALDLRLPAVLLGGSVVGLAGAGEKALAGRSAGAVLAWKTAFVTTGLATAYLLLAAAWAGAAGGGVLLVALMALPRLVGPPRAGTDLPAGERNLLAQLKNCC
jgi:hypothetical protein